MPTTGLPMQPPPGGMIPRSLQLGHGLRRSWTQADANRWLDLGWNTAFALTANSACRSFGRTASTQSSNRTNILGLAHSDPKSLVF